MDTYGRKLWLIETSGMSDYQKCNAIRVLNGMPELTEQEFINMEKQYSQ